MKNENEKLDQLSKDNVYMTTDDKISDLYDKIERLEYRILELESRNTFNTD